LLNIDASSNYYMKLRPLLLATMLGFAASAEATVSFLIDGDLLKTSLGEAAPQSTLFLLVASTTNSSFGPISPGASLDVGSILDGDDDVVLFRGDLTAYGVDGVLSTSVTGINFANFANFGPGDSLALYWFPTLTTASTTIDPGTTYGVYTSTIPVDGSAAWIAPADGTTDHFLFFYTQDGSELSPGAEASNPASAGNASLTVVPEPASMLLFGLAGLGMMTVRRRRA
jgi:hypothetical protein